MLIIFFVEQYGVDYIFVILKYFQGLYENFFMFIVEVSEVFGLRINGKVFLINIVYKVIFGIIFVGGYILIIEGIYIV